MNNLPKVVAQQRRSRASNPRLLDRKSDALPLSHRATPKTAEQNLIIRTGKSEAAVTNNERLCSISPIVLLKLTNRQTV